MTGLWISVIIGRLHNMINIFDYISKLTNATDEGELLQSLGIQYIVIESTSRCNLKCVMCPRNFFEPDCEDISIELFKKISKYFNSDVTVNLAGWGEPLIHPELAELIRITKDKKASVGFTTNATLLDKEQSIKLIESELDFIDFSLDGGTVETYGHSRYSASFEEVVENIKKFVEMKRRLNSNTPRTSITFVMMKKNLYELPLMVRFVKDFGIDKLVAKNFNVIANEHDIEQVVFTHSQYNKPDNNFIESREQIIEDSIALAKKLNVDMEVSPIETTVANRCRLASSALFISHTGDVSICCATGYPVPRMLNKKDKLENAKIIYGNINKSKLDKILKTKEYEECKIKAASGIIPVECNGCLLVEGI